MEQEERLMQCVLESNSMKLNKGCETPGILCTIRDELAEVGDIDIALNNALLIDNELFNATSYFRDKIGNLKVLKRGCKYNA